MTVINGTTVRWDLSPRLFWIPAAVNDITAQNYLDTARKEHEHNLMNLSEVEHLVDGTGKQPLGGGQLVGMTITSRNTKIAFNFDPTPKSIGTVTIPDANGTTLIDSVATFIADGVTPGAWIVNLDDRSISAVITIDSEIQISCIALGGGTENDWDAGENYIIWNVVRKTILGGNVVAVDDAEVEMPLIFPTPLTQVVVARASDATLQELEAIQYSSFNGGVTIDVVNGQSGVNYPIGTPEFPSDNWNDTKAIAISRGFTDIFIKGAYTFGVTDDISGYDLRALNVLTGIVSLTPGVITTDTIFRNMSVQGTLNGKALVYESFILDLAGFNGTINRCGFLGTITLAGSTVCHMIRCYDGFEGFGEPIINFGGSGRGLNMRDYHGGLRLENKSGGEDVSIGLNGGRLEIAADVTNGEILVRGVGEISEDLGSATVVDRTVNRYSLDRILGLVQENQFIDNQVYTAGKLTSARLRIYSVAGSVGTDSDVLATYTITATYSGNNLDTYKMVKV